MNTIEKHPDQIAWEAFQREHAESFNPHSITKEYLHNRLWWAFFEGIKQGERNERNNGLGNKTR